MTMPTIRTARAICKQGQLQGVIVIGIDEDGRVGGASYGASMKQCRQLAPWLELIVGTAGRVSSLTEFTPKRRTTWQDANVAPQTTAGSDTTAT